ncbi:hypothetical protein JHK87_010561 [Glycine soja]|nr:hypothetical protein JHK87_010561 [Glycine soja]
MDANKRRVTYFYKPNIDAHYHGEEYPMNPFRVDITHNLIVHYGLHRLMQINRPFLADKVDIARFHSDDYVEFLSTVSPQILAENFDSNYCQLKRFNIGGDFPILNGLFDFCRVSAGGSIGAAVCLNCSNADITINWAGGWHHAKKTKASGFCYVNDIVLGILELLKVHRASAGGSIGAAVRLNREDADVAINWAGGLHHAKKAEASGFCYVNDIVLGILELLKVHRRVLYIDIDVHHGDGVEEAFYTTDRVMTVSFHKFGDFFPGTGHIKDIGVGAGKNYSLNVPLNDGLDDETFRGLFRPIIQKVMDVYQPDAVVLQCGADSLSGDRLGCFNLTVKGHADCLRFLRSFNVPLMVLGGGGYTVRNVARCWCYETAVAVGVEPSPKLPYNEYYEYFGPDYNLHVEPSTMENLNTPRDLEKIRNTLLEQLSRLPHAPSAPFQTTPSVIEVPEEEEEDMDVRPKRRIWSGEDFDSDHDDDMASSKNSDLTAQTRAMQFLRGLNEQYANIRSHVLLMDPIPSISKILSYVAQQERQLLGNTGPSINFEPKDISINAAKTTCNFCGRIGHVESACYKKHEVPSNYDAKNKSNIGRKTCTHCGKIGHTVDFCYRKHGYPPGYKPYSGRTTVNNVVAVESKATDDQAQHHESHEFVRFSPEQYKALLALIQEPSAGNTTPTQPKQVASISSCTVNTPINPGMSLSPSALSTSWILDSGATNHVTCSLHNLHSHRRINPIIVKLSNCQYVHATHSGTVQLSPNITLHNVLYIPTFTFNLISISKLVSSINCELIFSSTSCVLQEMNNHMKIGIVEAKHGLYHLIPN